jgi:glyoxylase-like metal-dependent hydrolase (beta-lactamase superfamily II)
MTNPHLPAGVTVWERGWLSANNVLLEGPDNRALVDSGYSTHAAQTVALVTNSLGPKPLDLLVNTHLHSDHCGGNHALQARYPHLQTWIPPGQAGAVAAWDTQRLSYAATGQQCPPFTHNGLLQPGHTVWLGQHPWDVHAAPGHDPDAVLLHQPGHGVLVSGDALWDNGFGVVFPELDGEGAFEAVGATLDLIASLNVHTVIPGHGPVFGGGPERVAQALARARSRLDRFVQNPQQHDRYAAKVLLKFKLQEFQRVAATDLASWAGQTPLLTNLHRRAGGGSLALWLQALLQELANGGALVLDGGWVVDR